MTTPVHPPASFLCLFSASALQLVACVLLCLQTFLLKLASPGQEKAMLLLESGVRFHTTK